MENGGNREEKGITTKLEFSNIFLFNYREYLNFNTNNLEWTWSHWLVCTHWFRIDIFNVLKGLDNGNTLKAQATRKNRYGLVFGSNLSEYQA